MKKHSSGLYASLSASSIESSSSDFETLSLRVSHRSAGMALVLNAAFQRPVLTLFTDEISQHLAYALLDSAENASLIREEIANGVQPGSALDLLLDAGVINELRGAGLVELVFDQ